jgi:hypothetical protein
MTALPLEIWETTASLAACDGGPTACAIRATCGRLREAVERIRFRVVYVSGLERIQALLRSLEDVPAGSRWVEHLYIAYDDRMDFYYTQDGLAQPWECVAGRLPSRRVRRADVHDTGPACASSSLSSNGRSICAGYAHRRSIHWACRRVISLLDIYPQLYPSRT